MDIRSCDNGYMENTIATETATADTFTIAASAFDALIAATTPDPVYLCKEFVLAKEAIAVAEERLDTLKPLIEALRTDKETFFEGKFRNKAGKFKINHVVTGKDNASVKVLRAWLEKGKISQADYDEAVKYSDGTHNRVTFKAGTGK